MTSRRAPELLLALGALLLALAGTRCSDGDADGHDADELADEAAPQPAPAPRLYRLTHAQWENTVQDLFGLPEKTGLSELFRMDPRTAGHLFDNDVSAFEVDDALWQGYRVAAATVAERVTDDPALLAELVPPAGPSTRARAEQFVREFGERAYRRPLTGVELEELLALFKPAPGLYSTIDDPFTAGVRHVIEVVLQSPLFLYRVELSAEPDGEVIPLSSWELAARLSYFLWNTAPDAELMAAAEKDALRETGAVAAQALRMLEDPRAAAVVESFHAQLLALERLQNLHPSAALFPDVPDNLGELALEEHARFVRDVVFAGGGGLFELLTASDSFVNAELAAVYGLAGPGDDAFVEVALDPRQRRGVLTQVAFLAANASSVDPDPIARGALLARRFACIDIAARPDGAPPLPASAVGQTNRERVAAHTEQPGSACVACHGPLINPFGFAFEHYDAIGAHRVTDNGRPVDASATVLLGPALPVPVADAIELVEAMADSQAVHECYARRWIEYATGRPAAPEDARWSARLGEVSLADRRSIKRLLADLVTSPAFRNRAPEELP